MSIFKFLKRNAHFVCFAIALFATFFISTDAFAQVTNANTGPFQAFLQRGSTLFMQTRNALFVIAAFAFIQYAYGAIKDGSIDKEKIFWLIVGLVLLGVAGWIVSYLANPNTPDTYMGLGDLQNTQGWD